MTEQPTEAARVKVADIAGFDAWRSFRMTSAPDDAHSMWIEKGFGTNKAVMIKGCAWSVSVDDTEQRLLARYPFDPEALYFSADHPEGVPVEWEDAKS